MAFYYYIIIGTKIFTHGIVVYVNLIIINEYKYIQSTVFLVNMLGYLILAAGMKQRSANINVKLAYLRN